MNKCKRNRKSVRLQGYDYSSPGAYFVTVCTWSRECLFGHVVDEHMAINEAGRIVVQEWLACGNVYPQVRLDTHVVMPNHFHGIVVIDESSLRETVTAGQRRQMILPKIMGRFKMRSSKRINRLRNTVGLSVWQRGYYDHIIRNEEDLIRIQEYITNNPLKWELDRFYL